MTRCATCAQKESAWKKAAREKNPDKYRKRAKELYRANLKRYRGYFKKYRDGNKKKISFRYMSSMQKRRMAVLEKFGNKCSLCGFSDSRALQIDHVNGGGARELLKHKSSSDYYYKYLNKVIQDRCNKYRLLCANCNWIEYAKRREVARSLLKNSH